MTQFTEDATVDGLPAFWEALRMVSGLIAVFAVAAIVFTSSLFDASEAQIAPAVGAPRDAGQPSSPGPRASGSPFLMFVPPQQALLVVYLVQTPEQAELADWGEQQAAIEANSTGMGWRDRSYAILYARNEEEEKLAGLEVLDAMLRHGDLALIQVVDMRSTGAGF